MAVYGAGMIATGGPVGWIGGTIVTGTGIVMWGSGIWTAYQGWRVDNSVLSYLDAETATPTIPEEYTPLPAPDFQYDPSNPDEIARNSSISLNVVGGCSPFTWSVSGVGFTLDNAIITGLTNILNADGTACGSAAITVTGSNGTVVTGYVRCTIGTLNFIESCGSSTGSCSVWVGKYLFYATPQFECDLPENCPYTYCAGLVGAPCSQIVPELDDINWCNTGNDFGFFCFYPNGCPAIASGCQNYCDPPSAGFAQCPTHYLYRKYEWTCP